MGSSWPRNSSSETVTSRSAPSKSPLIGKLHATASWAAAVQERVLDPGQQRRQAPAGRQRRRVVRHIDGGRRRHPGQLGPGLRIQRASPGQHLLYPGPRLALEQHRQVVADQPAELGGRAARIAASTAR
jgi:hypothetical protein